MLVCGIATSNDIHGCTIISHCIKQINDTVVTLVADKLKDNSNDRLILVLTALTNLWNLKWNEAKWMEPELHNALSTASCE